MADSDVQRCDVPHGWAFDAKWYLWRYIPGVSHKCLLVYKDNRKSYGQWHVICLFSKTSVLGVSNLGSKVIQLHGSVLCYGATDHPAFWCCTAKVSKRLYPWKDKTFVQKWKKTARLPKSFIEKLLNSVWISIFAEQKWQFCQNISIETCGYFIRTKI